MIAYGIGRVAEGMVDGTCDGIRKRGGVRREAIGAQCGRLHRNAEAGGIGRGGALVGTFTNEPWSTIQPTVVDAPHKGPVCSPTVSRRQDMIIGKHQAGTEAEERQCVLGL